MEVLMNPDTQGVLFFGAIALVVVWVIALIALPFIVWNMKDATREMLRELKHLNTLVASFKSELRQQGRGR